jgi:hypothetical protein
MAFSANAMADESADIASAHKFWKTLAKGDTDALKAFYAPKVVLKAGSELLKQRWGISKEADRSKDLLVSRDDLLGGYGRMINEIGKEKWSQLLTRIEKENIHVSTSGKDDQPFAGVKRGDTILKVATGPGDDALHFILRREKDGKLLVHFEATDY